MLACQSSSVSSSIGLGEPLPALLTRMSTRPNRVERGVGERGGAVGGGDVGGHRDDLAPEAAISSAVRSRGVAAPSRDHEVRTFGREGQRDVPADALAPARDDGDPFPQAEFHGPERTQDRRSPRLAAPDRQRVKAPETTR